MASPKGNEKLSDLKPREVLCSYCTGKCCRYFALPIETPTTWDDFYHIRLYIFHGKVAIFVEDDTWFLMVYADCEHLQEDHRCGIYQDRPSICRSYTTDNCEYDNDACYDKFFESGEQIWEYAEAVLPPKKRDKANQNNRLPVMA